MDIKGNLNDKWFLARKMLAWIEIVVGFGASVMTVGFLWRFINLCIHGPSNSFDGLINIRSI